MNFSPFGSHFTPSLPNIHQFAAKLSQDFSTTATTLDDITLNRYTANGIPSFTQHHHATAQQQLLANKTNGNYLNSQTVYGQGCSSKPQNLEPYCLRSDRGLLGGESASHKRRDQDVPKPAGQSQHLSSSWQNLTASVDYLSQLSGSSLPISLHDFLKYSAENLKKDNNTEVGEHNLTSSSTINVHPESNTNGNLSTNCNNTLTTLNPVNPGHLQANASNAKKKKKKRTDKEKKPKPRPGEIRVSTALDGSTLYCCPECHTALPERDLLEQHLLGHNMERRFVCDICGAALKRKDHLTRHKQSHNPERPFICSVCLKAFKRKEQLTLHFVIHSGEKRHVCNECGKGFYRKDHLRKHTRSHIARRVKAELSQQGISSHGITS